MSFLTAEEVKAIRLKGSELLPISGIEKKIRLCRLSGAAAIEFPILQAKIKAGEKTNRDLFLFLLSSSCTDESGDTKISTEDAAMIFDETPYAEVLEMIARIVNALGSESKKTADAVPPGKS